MVLGGISDTAGGNHRSLALNQSRNGGKGPYRSGIRQGDCRIMEIGWRKLAASDALKDVVILVQKAPET